MKRSDNEFRKLGTSRSSEACYQAIVEKIPAILYCDPGGESNRSLYISPQARSLLGCIHDKEEPSSAFWTECVHPDDLDRVLEIRHRARQEGRPIRCEYRLIGPDGESRWFLEKASVSRQTDGSTYVHGVLFDITDRKHYEEALLKREIILEAVAFAAEQFLSTQGPDVPMDAVLERLGTATEVSRVYIFENHLDSTGVLCTSQRYEWVAPGIEPQIQNPNLQNFRWHQEGFSRWVHIMEQGEPVYGLVQDFPEEERPILEAQGIRSIVVMPIFVDSAWWGFIGFDECRSLRQWDPAELEALRIAALMVGAMIRRRRMDEELYRSQETLEQKIKEQTLELQEANRRLLLELQERKRAEALLRDSERRYRELYERSLDGYARMDLDLIIRECNTPFAAMLGHSHPEGLIGRSFLEILPDRDHDSFREIIRNQILVRGFSNLHEKQLLRKDGSPLDVELRWYLERDDRGEPRGIWTVIRDITERRAIEQERLRAQKLESLGVLAGGIAHDFNNILTAILGQVSLMKHALSVGAPLESRLEELEKGCLRARELTGQLLTFSKGGSPVKKTGSLHEVICESARFTLRGTATRYEFFADPDLWTTEFDEGQISQVIQNLVLNAHQAMPDGGVVRIEVRNRVLDRSTDLPLDPGRYVAISVTDSGCGIAPEHLPKIFDPYFTTKEKGSGLGLATAYSIVKKHGGHVTVQSAPGEGATFTVYLPASETASSERVAPRNTAAFTGTGRILVMDDDPVVLEVLAEMLEYMGFECQKAENGQEAVTLYEKAQASGYPFDAVILDLTVPGGMGGVQTIQKLRELDPQVRAIVSSGYCKDPVMAHPEKYGFRGTVAKPYRIEDLAAELQRVLSEGNPPS